LIAVRERQFSRRTSFKTAAFRDTLAGAGASPSQVEIWYKPEDEEAMLFALGLLEQLGFAGWHPQRPIPIPTDAVSFNLANASSAELAKLGSIERIGAAPTGLSLFSREFDSPLATTLFEALIAGTGTPLWRSSDPRLDDDAIRVIVGVKP